LDCNGDGVLNGHRINPLLLLQTQIVGGPPHKLSPASYQLPPFTGGACALLADG
jgi:hypothetical protein